MSLEQYLSKRDFEQTGEPLPSAQPTPGTNRFCLQRHQARRLHYDLRLEYDGVLKSWAIPKGPSLAPMEKRMAVATEDHPLEYLKWEGVIPEGSYGAGSMLVFDLGTFCLRGEGDFGVQLDRGDLKLFFRGRKLQGEYALVRTQQNWLWIKKTDPFCDPSWDPERCAWSVVSGRTQAEVEAGEDGPGRHLQSPPEGGKASELPEMVSPMLAKDADPFDHPDWTFEMKWDGFRALAYGQQGQLRLLSRKGTSLTVQFPELQRLRQQVAAQSYILDGEIVSLDEEGVPDFQKLLPRMHSQGQATVAQLSRTRPAVYYLFDLIYLDGYDLSRVPFKARLKLLAEIVRVDSVVRLSDTVEGQGRALFEVVRQRGLEGIVAKRKGSLYHFGRSDDWLKIKVSQTLDCVVCGFTAPKGGRERLGSLVLGRFREGRLAHVGNAGSGFSSALLQEVGDLLEARAVKACPFDQVPKLDDPVTWVRPELVCEVKYSSWNDSGVVRFPVFLRLRPDLDPDQCQARQAPNQMVAKGQPEYREVEGRTLKISNPEKVLFPGCGYTKRDLIDYYDAVSDAILPHLAGRPLSLKRYPDGIEGPFFFQKRPSEGFAEWVETVDLTKSDGTPVEGIVCNDRASLLYLANLACIDQNPTLSRIPHLDEPDFCLFDLDPIECSLKDLYAGALLLRQLLEAVGLKAWCKTSGSRGLHLYVPVARGHRYEQTRLFVQVIVQVAAQRRADLFTLSKSPGKRAKGNIFVDYPQNREGGTTAGVYVVRAVPGALVSMPLAWDEVEEGVPPDQFHLKSAPSRLQEVGDLFAPLLTTPQSLEQATSRLEELL